MALPRFAELDVESLPWKQITRKHALPEGITLAKRSHSRLVLSTTFAGERLFVKRGVPRTWRHKLSVRLQGTKLLREWNAGREFLGAGVIVPEPVFYAEDKQLRSYLATLAFPESWRPIDQVFKFDGLSQTVLDDLAQYTRWLHDLPAYHDDYRTDHIYMTNAPAEAPIEKKFALLDLDGASVGKRVSPRMAEEAIHELFLSLLRRGFSREQAARFVRLYNKEGAGGVDAERIFDRARSDYEA